MNKLEELYLQRKQEVHDYEIQAGIHASKVAENKAAILSLIEEFNSMVRTLGPEAARELGLSEIVAPEGLLESEEELQRLLGLLNAMAATVERRGMDLLNAYSN